MMFTNLLIFLATEGEEVATNWEQELYELIQNELVQYVVNGIVAIVGVILGCLTIYKKVSTMFSKAKETLDSTNTSTSKQNVTTSLTNAKIEETNNELKEIKESNLELQKTIAILTKKIEDNSRLTNAFSTYISSNTTLVKNGVAKRINAMLGIVPKEEIVKDEKVKEETKVGE